MAKKAKSGIWIPAKRVRLVKLNGRNVLQVQRVVKRKKKKR